MTTRQQRRQFERQLRKLIRAAGDNCSLCGAEFQHNGRTFGGYDQHGKMALVGECCVERLHKIYTAGLFSCRNYDFLPAGQNSMTRGLGLEQVVNALARFPFDGEVGPEDLVAPEGHRLLVLLRQVEPGKRIKNGFFISNELLPMPDVEAVAHALFDIATRRQPIPRNGKALCALIDKYQASREA
jgi:hypothetical protein